MTTEDKTNLLIVDDLPENLLALDALIRGADRCIYKASSADVALDLLLEHDFAVAILDVQMPEVNGFELAALMRGTERTRHIPIIFVTAAGDNPNYAFKGYETGAVDFLYKPLDHFAVRSKVGVFVALHQQRTETGHQLAALEQSRHAQELLVQQLNATQLELQRALQMRDDFMSMVAHELRTPLNTLFLETQVRTMQIKRGNQEAFALAQMATMVARDERQIHAMIRLIDDMLDVTRLRNNTLSIRPAAVELSHLLHRVIGDLERRAKNSGSLISLDTGFASTATTEGKWDEFRIEQIIVNLLTNAIHYGAGKPITVRLEADAQQARISVRDHGQGIAEVDQARIFAPFERGTDNKISSGLGLGLYISRQLAQAHHGTLNVHSVPGDGATFTLVLPHHPPTGDD